MTEESIGGSKELTVCKNQLAHFKAAAQRLREQRDQLRSDFACAESEVLVLTDELEHLKAENAKLRELCRRFAEYVSQDRCEGCACKCRCNDGEIDECWQRTEIREAAHELGIEAKA